MSSAEIFIVTILYHSDRLPCFVTAKLIAVIFYNIELKGQ
jgi:hypothetical protein